MRIFRRLDRWLKDPRAQEITQEEQHCIQSYLQGEDIDLSSLAIASHHISLRHSYQGIVGLMRGEVEALTDLYQGFYYDYAQIKADDVLYQMYTHPDKFFVTSFNQISLALANAITLGCLREAEQLGSCIFRSLDTGQIDDQEPARVAPFLTALYGQWKGLPPRQELTISAPYSAVLEYWQSEETAELEQALLEACEFHIERSQNNSRDVYEFRKDEYWLYPVEILAVLRLREMRGLASPVLEHPLMQTPVGHLYEVRQMAYDPPLEAMFIKSGLR